MVFTIYLSYRFKLRQISYFSVRTKWKTKISLQLFICKQYSQRHLMQDSLTTLSRSMIVVIVENDRRLNIFQHISSSQFGELFDFGVMFPALMMYTSLCILIFLNTIRLPFIKIEVGYRCSQS